MKKTRHTEEQIAFALKRAETGTSVAEVIRRMGDVLLLKEVVRRVRCGRAAAS
jgi:hypothetical protein